MASGSLCAEVDDGDAGQDIVSAVEEGADDLLGFARVGGCADEAVVHETGGVGAEDEGGEGARGGVEGAGPGLEVGEGGDPLLRGDVAAGEGGVFEAGVDGFVGEAVFIEEGAAARGAGGED